LISQEETTLETKGSAIQQMLLNDFCKFGSVDLVTGDVDGTVTMFSKSQILSRVKVFPSPVTSLAFDGSSFSVAIGGRQPLLYPLLIV
jgi:hypothetical protein